MFIICIFFLIQINDIIVSKQGQTKYVLEYIDFPDEGKIHLMFLSICTKEKYIPLYILCIHVLIKIQYIFLFFVFISSHDLS